MPEVLAMEYEDSDIRLASAVSNFRGSSRTVANLLVFAVGVSP